MKRDYPKTAANPAFLVYTIVFFLLISAGAVVSFVQVYSFADKTYRGKLTAAAALLDDDCAGLNDFSVLEEAGAGDSPLFASLQRKMNSIAKRFELSSIYILQRAGGAYYYVIASEGVAINGSAINGGVENAAPVRFARFENPPAELDDLFEGGALPSNKKTFLKMIDTRLRLFYPVARGGNIVGLIGADYSGNRLALDSMRSILVLLCCGAVSVLAALLFALQAFSATRALAETVQSNADEFEKKTTEAESASESKSRLLAAISHEVRTPMNVIQGMTELMRTDNLDVLQKNYLGDIRKMSASLLQIINDILDFSKIEAGQLEIKDRHYNFASVFDGICSLGKFAADSKSLLFKSSIDNAVPRVLYGDEQRVRQIILNLVNNAVKYTNRGYIYLCANIVRRAGEPRLAISVEDSGAGFKQEELYNIFGSFQKIDGKRSRGIIGAGLGLSICKQLALMMGGEINVDSEAGKGSIFTAYLPFVEGDPDKIEIKSSTPRIIANDSVKVLVVDDNTINLTVALGFLETHNIKADTAVSGAEALKEISKKRYDLVFMDHMMPEMDGTVVTQRIREMQNDWCKTVPIIALSANALAGVRDLFISSGMNDFIAKPIDADELNLVLSRWLPANKITNMVYEYGTNDKDESAEEKEAVPSENLFDAALESLSNIPDLNVKAGLSHVGKRKDIYLSVLKQFCEEYDAYVREITKFTAEENWHDYSIRLRALKTIFMNMGNDYLSSWARRLEVASNGQDREACKKEVEPFCYAMYLLKEKLLDTPLLYKVNTET